MRPLVNDLFQDPGVGMLRGEAQAEQFQAHAGDLLDQARVVQEPPAAKEMEIAEFAGQHTQLVLVLPGQNRDRELVVRKGGAQVLQSLQFAPPHSIAGQLQPGIDRPPDPGIKAKGRPNSRQWGRIACSINWAQSSGAGKRKSGPMTP